MADRTRYQVMVNGESTKVERALDKNFPAGQLRQAKAYQRKLEKDGYKVSFWDCQNNALSKLFAGAFSR